MFSPHPLPPLPLLYIFQSLLQVLFGIIFPLLAHSRLLFSKVIAPAMYILDWGFPGGSNSKKSTCNAGDPGSVLGSRRSPGEGNGNPFQYSCLENSMDRGAWWAAVQGVAGNQTRLSDFTFTFHFHTLEKEMATHSSVLAWRIPGMGEPVGLLSLG